MISGYYLLLLGRIHGRSGMIGTSVLLNNVAADQNNIGVRFIYAVQPYTTRVHKRKDKAAPHDWPIVGHGSL